MRKLVYDVAVSLDGFISRPDGSIDGFAMEGEHVEAYLQRLQGYDTAVMGRNTYEAGYAYGLQPGERAYPHMEHYIVSSTLSFDGDQVQVVADDPVGRVRALKETTGSEIYLCGGGQLAGTLLKAGLIDRLIVKLNPVILGAGIPVFGDADVPAEATLVETKAYGSGVTLLTYAL